MTIKQPWEIKYRPKKLDDIIFDKFATAEIVKKWIADGVIPNLLLSGIRGTYS